MNATGAGPRRWGSGLRDGAESFDAGRYWDAHEHWEREWRGHASQDRHYLKGLIQFAAALHHLQRGKLSAARQLLERGPLHLIANRPGDWPFDTAHLVAVAAALAKSLDSGHPPPPPALHLVRMMDAWDAGRS